jgi:hypothetical protein
MIFFDKFIEKLTKLLKITIIVILYNLIFKINK